MFNLGNDDKEKLKENMEQIKNMVEGQGKSSEEQNDGFEDFPPEDQKDSFTEEAGDAGFPDQGDNNTPESFSDQNQASDLDDTQSFDQQTQEGFPPQNQQQNQGFPEQEQTFPDQTQAEDVPPQQEPREPKRPQQEPDKQKQDFEQEKDSSEKQTDSKSRVSSLNSQIPEAPESKEVDVPEIDKGPLFLRQQKFRRARELVEEMLYLSQDILETVNSLEAGIQEDQRTEQDIRQMLKEFSDDRSEIEGIISPKSEN